MKWDEKLRVTTARPVNIRSIQNAPTSTSNANVSQAPITPAFQASPLPIYLAPNTVQNTYSDVNQRVLPALPQQFLPRQQPARYQPAQFVPSADNRITNALVARGKLPQSQRESFPQAIQGMSRDNNITNSMVQNGALPQNQREIYRVPSSSEYDERYLPRF